MPYSFTDHNGNIQYADSTGQGTSNNPHILKVQTAETVQTLTTLYGNVAASGDTQLITAPGSGNRIVIHYLQVQLKAATETTVLIKQGTTKVLRDALCTTKGDGLINLFPRTKELRLDANTALVINLSGANQVTYHFDWSTEAV